MIRLPICDIGSHVDQTWNTYVNFIQADDEIPIPDHLDDLYLDFETTSERPKVSSVNPHSEDMDDSSLQLHKNCKIAGVAFLFDEEKVPYYVPVRHAYLEDGIYKYRQDYMRNMQPQKVYRWLEKITSLAKRWLNQQIKYDWHVLYNETGIIAKCKLVDSIILSKLAQFEERFEYGLTSMMRLIGVDITPYEKKIEQFLGKKYKDFGLIPPDDMATYAAVDVLSVRRLIRELKSRTSASTKRVEELEMNLLPIIINMEQVGCRVSIEKLEYDWRRLIKLQLQREMRIKKYSDFPEFILSGKGTKESHNELFVERLGWDLDFTDTSKEKLKKGTITEEDATFSFGYDSIRKHASKNPRLVASYLSYQGDQKLLTSYTQPILETHTSSEHLIHCNVNQQVRTGRMSVTSPGMQTNPPKAKYYFIPYTEDYILVEFDLSQIEFRVIVNYINNRPAIEAYKRDPSTDFHVWIQKMCELASRSPAKTCNFQLGYGGGKESFINDLGNFLRKQGITDPGIARNIAVDTYKKYHATLPELRPTSKRAEAVCRSRGHVFTLLGRERHINTDFSYRAFNSVCQGTAADMQKDITVRLKKFIGPDCLLHMLVHDSWLFSIRRDCANELIPEIKYEIERPIENVDFQVPLLSEYKTSEKSWGHLK